MQRATDRGIAVPICPMTVCAVTDEEPAPSFEIDPRLILRIRRFGFTRLRTLISPHSKGHASSCDDQHSEEEDEQNSTAQSPSIRALSSRPFQRAALPRSMELLTQYTRFSHDLYIGGTIPSEPQI